MAAISETLANPLFPQAASIEEEAAAAKAAKRYYVLKMVNRGSYGVVYRAWDNEIGEAVAMKHELYGMSQTTAREIFILSSLPPHPSVVGFKKAVVDGQRNVLLVMEYLPNDLYRLISEKRKMAPFTTSEVKRMMRQNMEGVAFLHGNRVMHKDLKPSNILINDKAECKICDFGLSRHCHMGESGAYTPRVGTRWYKAPELLLGVKHYSSAIHMWSVGCIMAELVTGKVLFPGNSQMLYIYQNLRQLRARLGAAARFGGAPVLSGSGIDLLLSMLEVDMEKRITAKDALNHPWFREFYCLSVDH